ncbi:MAG: MotA/TolQ/ExbB proton channel family protein [Isosphaeraceae bacterium]
MSSLEIAGRVRFLVPVLVLAAGLGLATIAGPGAGVLRAQESGAGASGSGSAPGGAGGGRARTDSVADDSGAGGAATTDDQGEGNQSFLVWMFRASGPIGVVILLMSVYLVMLVVWMFLHFRTTIATPAELVDVVQDLLDQARYTEAYHRLAEDSSFFARVLAAGVRKLPAGLGPAQRAMELANEDVTMNMEHRTTYLATVGTLGPMIGLVGTVYGMIMAFRVIAQAGSSPQASDLAKGISTALFATLEGIAVSIPAIYFYALFRNRIARLSLEVGIQAEPLLERFASGVRMAGAGSGPGAGTGTGTGTGGVPAGPGGTAGPNPSAHAHPFAVSATMAAAAAGGAHATRPALPSAEPPKGGDRE